uniref:Riboflavin synthase n=2 Tax=Grammatophora oceanica TaxID=210454 RepID=A0A7S1UW73_9STRA|mmetsp:Transcript_26711/g.39041  ORF Transcript_26711/g.39041 Transcript_26711/m.39041 type:complete len:155 (+) Transcript_26711:169-633(+)
MARTYFADLKDGEPLNLERASEVGGRNSGHFVQGHVDGTGTIIYKQPVGDSLVIRVKTSPDILAGIVPKGFIAVDGTSLTVVDVNRKESWFSFMLVEYTQKKIIIPDKPIGGKVNLEVDVLGKYSVNAIATTILPRIEALEARIVELEKMIANK